MMNKVLIAAAIAGAASSVFAQDFSLSLSSNVATLDPSGGTFTVTVFGDASVGTHLLGGAFSLVSNGECISNMEWTPASWSVFNTDGGFAGNGDYNQVVFGQLVIPGIFPPAAGSELGSAIGTFTMTLDQLIGDISITFDLVGGDPFALETVDATTGETFQSSSGNLSLGSLTLAVIPSPSALSVLGLGGLVATRRRR